MRKREYIGLCLSKSSEMTLASGGAGSRSGLGAVTPQFGFPLVLSSSQPCTLSVVALSPCDTEMMQLQADISPMSQTQQQESFPPIFFYKKILELFLSANGISVVWVTTRIPEPASMVHDMKILADWSWVVGPDPEGKQREKQQCFNVCSERGEGL